MDVRREALSIHRLNIYLFMRSNKFNIVIVRTLHH